VAIDTIRKRMNWSLYATSLIKTAGRLPGMSVETLNFLEFVSVHEDVRQWVIENTSLLKSDAPCLSLSSAKKAIGRLVEVAKNTPHYLYDVDLGRLAAPGVGKELKRRLRHWSELKPTVLRLLLDTTAETGAEEVVPLACRIARDHCMPIPIRRSALSGLRLASTVVPGAAKPSTSCISCRVLPRAPA